MKPSDFTVKPMASVMQKSEAETVARNIMVILKRTGDEWRDLSFEEYKAERLKDGGFTELEENYFNQVIGYCKNADTAVLFSPLWSKNEASKLLNKD